MTGKTILALLLLTPAGQAMGSVDIDPLTFRKNFSSMMHIAYNGDFETCRFVASNMHIVATNRKIWGNDNQAMDVLTYLGRLGSEIEPLSAGAKTDCVPVRRWSVAALAAIGGEYARICVTRIALSEKYKPDESVVVSLLEALRKLGNDKSFETLKTARYIFDYMPKKNSSSGHQSVISYIQCMEKLCRGAPYKLIKQYGIPQTLLDLSNRDYARNRVYPEEIRTMARKAWLAVSTGVFTEGN